MNKEILITTLYINLNQLIKYVGLVSSGFEGKNFITSNKIKVNGLEEIRRGRKLYHGDVVVIKDISYIIKGEKRHE